MERIYNAAKAAIDIYGTHILRSILESRYKRILRAKSAWLRGVVADRQFEDIEKVMEDAKGGIKE